MVSAEMTNGGPLQILPTDVLNFAVNLHNQYRSRHESPPVELDPALCEEAQRYAHCILAHAHLESDDELLLSNRNIFRLYSPPNVTVDLKILIQTAMGEWYKTKEDYNWDNPMMSDKASKSFVHMVHKSCTKIGLGVHTLRSKTIVMVLYWPVGRAFESDRECRENILPVYHFQRPKKVQSFGDDAKASVVATKDFGSNFDGMRSK